MTDTDTEEEALSFKRRFRSTIIVFAIVEFILIASLVAYAVGWKTV